MTLNTEFKLIALDCLQRGQFQPRTRFDHDQLNELAQSILSQGLIEPLVVRKITASHYEIIAGERRWRAAMLAGLSQVPCLIGDYTDKQAAAVTLIENIQRQELTLLEEANGYQRLIRDFNFHQHEIAVLVGKSRSHVANILRLLTLCPEVQQRIHAGQLTLGHARMLVGLTSLQQLRLAQQIEDNQWSVRQLEQAVRQAKHVLDTNNPNAHHPDIKRLENQLAEQIGTPVHIVNDSNQGGWLNIKFYNNDTLTGLLDRLGLSYD